MLLLLAASHQSSVERRTTALTTMHSTRFEIASVEGVEGARGTGSLIVKDKKMSCCSDGNREDLPVLVISWKDFVKQKASKPTSEHPLLKVFYNSGIPRDSTGKSLFHMISREDLESVFDEIQLRVSRYELQHQNDVQRIPVESTSRATATALVAAAPADMFGYGANKPQERPMESVHECIISGPIGLDKKVDPWPCNRSEPQIDGFTVGTPQGGPADTSDEQQPTETFENKEQLWEPWEHSRGAQADNEKQKSSGQKSCKVVVVFATCCLIVVAFPILVFLTRIFKGGSSETPTQTTTTPSRQGVAHTPPTWTDTATLPTSTNPSVTPIQTGTLFSPPNAETPSQASATCKPNPTWTPTTTWPTTPPSVITPIQTGTLFSPPNTETPSQASATCKPNPTWTPTTTWPTTPPSVITPIQTGTLFSPPNTEIPSQAAVTYLPNPPSTHTTVATTLPTSSVAPVTTFPAVASPPNVSFPSSEDVDTNVTIIPSESTSVPKDNSSSAFAPQNLSDAVVDEPSVETAPPNNTAAPFDMEDLSFTRLNLPAYTLEALQNESSPQSMAYNWVRNHTVLSSEPEWRLVQHFALATVLYAYYGPSWEELNLDGNQIGRLEYEWGWKRLMCNDDMELVRLDFENRPFDPNYTNPFLPYEIGMLSSLYVVQVSSSGLQGTAANAIPPTMSESHCL